MPAPPETGAPGNVVAITKRVNSLLQYVRESMDRNAIDASRLYRARALKNANSFGGRLLFETSTPGKHTQKTSSSESATRAIGRNIK